MRRSGRCIPPHSSSSAVDRDEWLAECDRRDRWFDTFGEKLPGELRAQNDALRGRLG